MKSSPIKLKQKLSPSAAKKKAARDLAYAKSPARKRKKAQNQRIGQRSDSDLHHTGSAVKEYQLKITEAILAEELKTNNYARKK